MVIGIFYVLYLPYYCVSYSAYLLSIYNFQNPGYLAALLYLWILVILYEHSLLFSFHHASIPICTLYIHRRIAKECPNYTAIGLSGDNLVAYLVSLK